ncbi:MULTISPECIES: TauD/TfdA family dioxygenase [unclassified Tenacibaculum]|uniref:TauD/TfdA family dioxygenase n=1 Tax=unclassified Tenacibaculum TaxID=2635139 RepID=UPI001F3B7126|nr:MULTISPECIES: TauD/TfdA family dioxygenase [unclassified Tenacibaculum]MCF2875397.1 TauD/TfdA family dioxygenase [Tenacibaculum sp. Cn5-1]MCF2935473.1 TauD/TfdA family dioxygenase [Tenacibaculum sp. Cn5-34]MCG7512033.1 TauD/TfdA family dioxygenase [Tenacibaculum sp. Cn5-46]
MEKLDLLTRYKFNQNLAYEDIISELRRGDRIILLEDFPLSDSQFQSFINRIGTSIFENKNNDRKDIYDVKIAKQNIFFRSIANSNLSFPLHTDCADFDSIPNCIGLLCVEPAAHKQGTNTFMFLEDLLKQLSEKQVRELVNKKWNFRNQSRSILTKESSTYKLCYDRITIESFSKTTNAEKEQLNRLDSLFKQNAFELKLKKGELVLFRNDLMLHGRTEIDINSNRLVKRIRFDVN